MSKSNYTCTQCGKDNLDEVRFLCIDCQLNFTEKQNREVARLREDKAREAQKAEILIIKINLIALAAKLVCGQSMPSEYLDDYNLPKNTSQTTKNKITTRARNARNQCRLWGIDVRSLADQLGKAVAR